MPSLQQIHDLIHRFDPRQRHPITSQDWNGFADHAHGYSAVGFWPQKYQDLWFGLEKYNAAHGYTLGLPQITQNALDAILAAGSFNGIPVADILAANAAPVDPAVLQPPATGGTLTGQSTSPK